MIETQTFWPLTLGHGLGTYLTRFSFLGFLGGRTLPDWVLVHLKYVGVAIFPAMITPLVLWPAAAAFAVGMRFSALGAIIGGMGRLYLLQALGL